MDMNISGSGRLTAGEYDVISISGSAASEGLIRCRGMRCSGSFSGNSDIECEGDMRVSGSFKNAKTVKAGGFYVSGSAKNDGDVTADEVGISGSFRTKGNLRAAEIRISGGAKISGDVEAENARISGGIVCGGLINAEQLYVDIAGSSSSAVVSIGGSRIVIEKSRRIFSGLFGSRMAHFTVTDAIEGDDIEIEHTSAKSVSGRCVKIGDGCEIEVVQYTENADISPKAKVGKVEKI